MSESIEVEVERCAGECLTCDAVASALTRASQLEVEAHNLRHDAEVIRRKHIRQIMREPHLKDGSR